MGHPSEFGAEHIVNIVRNRIDRCHDSGCVKVPNIKKLFTSKWFILHPLLFAAFPILALYAYNMAELSFSETLIPLAASLGLALLLLMLSWLILRNAWKAGIITSIFLIIIFVDGHICSVLEGWGWGQLEKYLPIAWAIFFIGGVYLTVRTKRKLHKLTIILNIVGVCLVLVPSISIAANEFRRAGYDTQIEITGVQVGPSEVYGFPDIYYIVLDSYSSATTLKEFYNYDNSEFIHYLIGKGFYVANQSISNYSSTRLSIASSLNMEYVNYLSEVLGEESKDLTIPVQMIKNNHVVTFLRSMGYQYVHFETWSEWTCHNTYADLNVPTGCHNVLGMTARNEFESLLIESTILHRLTDWTSLYRAYVLNAFNKLAEMPELQGPKFVYAHIYCPHWPYVFGADGETIEVVLWRTETRFVQREKYLNQVKFVNKKLEILVDEILSKSQNAPIIILQADHGSRLFRIEDVTYAKSMQDKMRIFNAYYLPNGGDKDLYNSISPINTFRVVFNFYFGSDYELLSDHGYFSISAEPYKFVNVTDVVRYD